MNPARSKNSSNNSNLLRRPGQTHSPAAATETPGKTLAPLRSTSTSPAATLRYRAETFFLLRLGELFLYDCPFASLEFLYRENVETVDRTLARSGTPLKRGVNERFD